jgi:hypothetical protein
VSENDRIVMTIAGWEFGERAEAAADFLGDGAVEALEQWGTPLRLRASVDIAATSLDLLFPENIEVIGDGDRDDCIEDFSDAVGT